MAIEVTVGPPPITINHGTTPVLSEQNGPACIRYCYDGEKKR